MTILGKIDKNKFDKPKKSEKEKEKEREKEKLAAKAKADAALFYRLNKFVNFALNVDNVFDEVIFVNASVGSAIEIAAPRTLTLRTSFNF